MFSGICEFCFDQIILVNFVISFDDLPDAVGTHSDFCGRSQVRFTLRATLVCTEFYYNNFNVIS